MKYFMWRLTRDRSHRVSGIEWLHASFWGKCVLDLINTRKLVFFFLNNRKKLLFVIQFYSVKKDILPVVHSLCQDVNESVRACICSQLHHVAKGKLLRFFLM